MHPRRWPVVRFLPFALFMLLAGCRRSAAQEHAEPAPSAATSASATATEPDASVPRAATGSESDAASDAGIETRRAAASYRSVLHIGDSMVGYRMGLQLELSRMFKAAGVRYESRTFTAAGIHSFASEKHVGKLVEEKKPDLVLIQIGTNNLTVPHPEAYLEDLRAIVAQVGARACYWIGPIPIDRPEHGMHAVLRDSVEPCVFFDSFDLGLKRQDDAIHPTQAAAKKWADAFWAFAFEAPDGG